jgi:hypothetical protein
MVCKVCSRLLAYRRGVALRCFDAGFTRSGIDFDEF